MVKNPPINAGDMGSSPTSGRYPGEGTITYSRILAWEIPWTEEPGGLQSMGLHRVLERLSWWLIGKESACQCRRCGFSP